MAHENHEWRAGREPPELRPHSLAKHRVLKAYLLRYVETLTSRVMQDQFKVTLVDGFAGGGCYRDATTGAHRPGSPLIMLEAMRDAATQAQQRRNKEFNLDVEYFFVEKDPSAISYLRKTIEDSEFRPLLDGSVKLIHGTFAEHFPKIRDRIQSRGSAQRAIFNLDQFGYKDVPFQLIAGLLACINKAEVILTFAVDFLIDYLSDSCVSRSTLDNVGIQLPRKEIATLKQQLDWRRRIQFALHKEIPKKTGAKFYTPFFIRSEDSHRDFWLLHLSGHVKAKDVMLGLHWQESTAFAHYGRSGLRMLGYDPKRDPDLSGQNMLPGFYFDDTAKASSCQELVEQLPERLRQHLSGVSFAHVFESTTNESPVSADIMKSVVAELAREGFVSIKDKTGMTLRRGTIQADSDMIVPSPQSRFVFIN